MGNFAQLQQVGTEVRRVGYTLRSLNILTMRCDIRSS